MGLPSLPPQPFWALACGAHDWRFGFRRRRVVEALIRLPSLKTSAPAWARSSRACILASRELRHLPSPRFGMGFRRCRQSLKNFTNGRDMKILWSTLLIVLLGAAPGWAVLGEYASSIDLDQQILGGEQRELARQGYQVHELISPDGLVVKEFVSQAGLVFGVTWQAPQMPNLQQLLGDHDLTDYGRRSLRGAAPPQWRALGRANGQAGVRQRRSYAVLPRIRICAEPACRERQCGGPA